MDEYTLDIAVNERIVASHALPGIIDVNRARAEAMRLMVAYIAESPEINLATDIRVLIHGQGSFAGSVRLRTKESYH